MEVDNLVVSVWIEGPGAVGSGVDARSEARVVWVSFGVAGEAEEKRRRVDCDKEDAMELTGQHKERSEGGLDWGPCWDRKKGIYAE